MSVASRVQAVLMKRQMDRNMQKHQQRRGPPQSVFEESPRARPPKPISKMTKAELEAYYQGSGVF